MPINPRQFVNQMKQRRAATQNLHSEAGWSGYHVGYGSAGRGNHTLDRQGDVFGNNRGSFSMPNHQDRLESATGAARSAGVSERKINKVVGKAKEIGFNYGKEDLAFGSGKPNPFQGPKSQRWGKNRPTPR